MFTVAKDKESDASLETKAENDTPIHAKHRWLWKSSVGYLVSLQQKRFATLFRPTLLWQRAS